MMHLLPKQAAYETVYMDMITPVHKSNKLNEHIITLIDGYTKYAHA